MGLNHVSMWTDKGFQPTNPEKTAQIYQDGVSSSSGLFVCRLCGQYVSFVNRKKAPHFKHSRGEDDKNCPERSFGSSESVSFQLQMKRCSLPLRLTINSYSSFSLSIGIILPLGVSVPNGVIRIRAEGFLDSERVFQTNEHLTSDNISYFSLGQTLATKYTLTVPAALEDLIPSEIEGIPEEGCLFHVSVGNPQSGKRVPQGANVQTETDYYLLTKKKMVGLPNNVLCREFCVYRVSYRTWYVYQIRAKKFDENTARFFLEYRYILTESAVSLVPVWSLYRNSPYVTYHQGSRMWFYLSGQDVSTHSFPTAAILEESCGNGNGAEKVLNVFCNSRRQTLLAAKSKVLRYTHLCMEPLKTHAELPTIVVTDVKGSVIESGTSNILPKQGILRVQVHFDGKIIIRKGERVMEKRMLKAERSTEIDDICFGMSIEILQGLDMVWNICFSALELSLSGEDEKIYRRLCVCRGERIPFPHRFGAFLSGQLSGMPKTKRWLMEQMRRGSIPKDGFCIIARVSEEERCYHDKI